MADLFRKLNTLVKSNVGDLTPDNFRQRLPGLGKDMDREIAGLRERINEAIEHEDTLQKRVVELRQEVEQFDQQADEAVKQGNDAQARHLIAQMQRTQQRLTMAESDLQAHQLIAQELIQKVNLLEATVADVRREKAEEQAPPEDVGEQSTIETLTNVLKEAQEKIASRVAQPETPTDERLTETDQPVDEARVDDDLDARRNRLSKR